MRSARGSQARRLRDALEPIAMHGQRSSTIPDRLAEHGLDRFESYVWARPAALGTPAPSVVVSAFGVFEPGSLSTAYGHAGTKVARRPGAHRPAGRRDAGLAAVLGADDVAPLADALLDAVRPLPGTARPLFSALRELPVPTDPTVGCGVPRTSSGSTGGTATWPPASPQAWTRSR